METRDWRGEVKVSSWIALPAFFLTLGFWVLGVGVPLVALGARTPGVSGLLDPDVLSVAWVTARQAFLSAMLSVVIGLPLGLVAARASVRVARSLDTLLLLPQGVPTVVAATAWIALLGRSGLLAKLDLGYSLTAVIIAHVFFNAPWVALLVAQARRSVPSAPLEAAATLGAGSWARFRFGVWPTLQWATYAAAAQVVAVCSMSFALVMILGGGPPVETLETALYSRLRGGALDLGGAVSCAFWEMVLTLTPWLVVLALRARASGLRGSTASVQSRQLSFGASPAWMGWLAVIATVVFSVPYLAIFWGGGLAAILSGEFWTDASGPLRLSGMIAISVAAGTLLLAACAVVATSRASPSMRSGFSFVLSLPSGLSVLVLGLGMWLAYGGWIDPFEGSLAAIVGLQIIVFFPVAFRLLWPVAQVSQHSRMEAAWTLGASPWRAFWLVDWPRWRAPVASVLALVAALALGEVAAVSLFYSENLIPLPLLVSRYMGQYRFEEARAASALLFVGAMLLIVGVGMFASQKKEKTDAIRV